MSSTAIQVFYLAMCVEGGLFGEPSATKYMPSFRIDNNAIPGIYSGLFAIHLALHAAKRESDSSKPKITFYALGVLYVLTVALFIFELLPVVSTSCILFFFNFGLIQLCSLTSLYCALLVPLRPQYLVAAILSLSAFLYAPLAVLHLFHSSNLLHRYTVAGLCGVKISAS